MAHACAQIVRFTGHAMRPYSVAEHQLLCARIACAAGETALVQLLCLTHDLHEAYTGDIATPIKQILGPAWEQFEHDQAQRVRRHLGLATAFTTHRAQVKLYDLIALATERRDLLRWENYTSDPWPILDTPGAEIAPSPIHSVFTNNAPEWTHWRKEWLAMYAELRAEISAKEPA
jgi:5'-deoxynucleotidase YfbR-like HD superfamily hydrolase